MADAHAGSILRYLRQLPDAGATAELSDGQLVQRFVTHREEAAFAALVQRHGRLVWGVCRRLLHREPDAEDAFQATFLVLTRKAASIRKHESVASWLYGVAYRIARRLRQSSLTRREHEKRAGALAVKNTASETAWRELQTLLDDELQRLPEKYRAPFVLCCLEGKSKHEAAQELGGNEGTVSSRLARARQQLQKRLTSRGVSLSAILCGTALAQNTASAAVPATLLDATVRALVQGGGNQAGGMLSAPVVALADAAIKSVLFPKLTLVTVFLLATGMAGLGVDAFTDQSLIPSPGERFGSTVLFPTPAPEDPNPRMQADPLLPDALDPVPLAGRVLDPAGKPIAHAPVAVLACLRPLPGQRWPPAWQTIVSGTANVEGQFQLQVPGAVVPRLLKLSAVAGSSGYGLGWQLLDPSCRQLDTEVRLHPERILRGRLVDLQGQPAAGAWVHVKRLWDGAVDEPGPNRLAEPENRPPFWPQPVACDAQGRFVVRGLARRVRGTLEVQDDRFAPQGWAFRTDDAGLPAAETIHALAPARILEGRITYADTGTPVAQARMVAWGHSEFTAYVHGQTNAEGRYQLNISPEKGFGVTVFAPDGQPYLGLFRPWHEWPRGKFSHSYDLALPRGISVRGRITEEITRKPVAGAMVDYWQAMFVKNPSGNVTIDFSRWPRIVRPAVVINPSFSSELFAGSEGARLGGVRTGLDGVFRIPVLPGPGHLLIHVPGANYVNQRFSESFLYGEAEQANGTQVTVNGLVALNLKPQTQSHELAVALRRVVTLKGRLVGPEGQRVAAARVLRRLQNASPEDGSRLGGSAPVPDDRLALDGCDPQATYRLFLLDAQNQWGTVAQLSGQQADQERLTIGLVPCGSAVVRVVGTDAKPVADTPLSLVLVAIPAPAHGLFGLGRKELSSDIIWASDLDPAHYGNDLRTDAQGRCTLPALIPGATYRIQAQEVVQEFTVQPGQTLRLRDLVINRANAGLGLWPLA